MNISSIEKTIGIKSEDWKGHCHLIASKLLEHNIVQGTLCYGNFFGEIHPDSLFADYSFPRHGWVKLSDGRICDPTRWVFENKKPYIFIEFDLFNEYDFGGNKFKEIFKSPQPEFNPKSRQFEIGEDYLFVVRNILNIDRNFVSIEELIWMASLSLNILQNEAKPVFEFVQSCDLSAFIPIDNRQYILGF